MNNPSVILVDADAFFALSSPADSNYHRAQKMNVDLLRRPTVFQLSNYTFAETVSVLARKLGSEEARAFIRRVESETAPLQFRWVDEAIHAAAIHIFEKQASKNVSFFDCVNMAIMQEDGLDAIFSFDEAYKKNGLTMVEDFLKG